MTIKRVVTVLLECSECGDVVGAIPANASIQEAQEQLARGEKHACVVFA